MFESDACTMPKARVAIVSPFIDKRHGTERRVAEWVAQLTKHFEIHIYSQHVEDLDAAQFTWHRIPKIPGPHLVNYLWWYAANRLWRFWDRRFSGLRHDIVFSAGINCSDANVISVHIVFAQHLAQARQEQSLRRSSAIKWPRLLHRSLYYRLICSLEKRIYTQPDIMLVLIAHKTADELKQFYGRSGQMAVVYAGIDERAFNPLLRAQLREEARESLGLGEESFALLLIGNNWKHKGLACLVEAFRILADLPLCLLIAGQDDPYPYEATLRQYGLRDRVKFLQPRRDVQFLYAAADVYVAPSLGDTFAQPPVEAMACGLPVILSVKDGASEIVTDGVDGLILQDPRDSSELASKIRQLWQDAVLRSRLGERASNTTREYTWQRNGEQLREILEGVLRRKVCRR